MTFVVPAHLAYCFDGGRPIFLDIVRARYFTLPDALGRALDTVLRGQADTVGSHAIESLIRHGVLQVGAGGPSRQTIAKARRDVEAAYAAPFSLRDAAGVAKALFAAQRSLAREPFNKTLSRLQARRPAVRGAALGREPSLATRFRRHRSLVGIRSVCLLDSLALRSFLQARGGEADLVFGVIGSPFAAHCWLQVDDLVLNDSLERVSAFTPILVL